MIAMRYLPILVILSLFACSSPAEEPEEEGPVELPANPCATPGATYLQHFETLSGNCGNLPDQILNITNDGKVPFQSGVECQVVEQDGCRAHNSNCRTTVDVAGGHTCTLTLSTDVTFADDGASAEGLESVSGTCSDGSSCSGTYRITSVRQ